MVLKTMVCVCRQAEGLKKDSSVPASRNMVFDIKSKVEI